MFGEKLKRFFTRKKTCKLKKTKPRKADSRNSDSSSGQCPPTHVQETQTAHHIQAKHDDKVCGSFIVFQTGVTGNDNTGIRKLKSAGRQRRISSAISSKSAARDTGDERDQDSPQQRKRQHVGLELNPKNLKEEEPLSCRDIRWAHNNKRTWKDAQCGKKGSYDDEIAKLESSDANSPWANDSSFSENSDSSDAVRRTSAVECDIARMSSRYRPEASRKSGSEAARYSRKKPIKGSKIEETPKTQSLTAPPNTEKDCNGISLVDQKTRRRKKNGSDTKRLRKRKVSNEKHVKSLIQTMETPKTHETLYFNPLMISMARSGSSYSNAGATGCGNRKEQDVDELSIDSQSPFVTLVCSSDETPDNSRTSAARPGLYDIAENDHLVEEMEKLISEIELHEQGSCQGGRNEAEMSNSFIKEVDMLLDEAEKI